MHIGTLKKMALALTFWLALHMPSLRAQIFTAPLQASTTGTNPVDFEFRADGTMIAKGNYNVGSLLTGDQGAGTRLLWYPKAGAFRAGTVTGTKWDSSHIGIYSFAHGYDTSATGSYSTASGYDSTASGWTSAAFNLWTTSSGNCSAAFGCVTTASGNYAMATGSSTTASGSFALSAGHLSLASGTSSLATGTSTTASGVNAMAAGCVTTASAYASFAVGTANVGGGSATTWVATDPLFEIGNGKQGTSGNPAATGHSDALIVYKNGNAVLQGTLQVSPGGDIPMFTGM